MHRKLMKWAVIFSFLPLVALPVFASEEETNQLKDKKLLLTLAFGYGISYANQVLVTGGRLFGLDPQSALLLETLGLELSDNVYSARLTLLYTRNQRWGLYGVLPTALVETRSELFLPGAAEFDNLEVGLGDLGLGLYVRALPETATLPSVLVYLDLNSDVGRYSSLGNGLWDVTLGATLGKSLASPWAVLADLDYTHSLSEGGLDPGAIVGFGGRVRRESKYGTWEVGLKHLWLAEHELRGHRLTAAEEDLVLTAELKPHTSARHWVARSSLKAYLTHIDEGLDLERNTFGVRWSFPLWVR